MNKSILAVSIAMIAGAAQAADLRDINQDGVYDIRDNMVMGQATVGKEITADEQAAIDALAEAAQNYEQAVIDRDAIQAELDQAYADLDIANTNHRIAIQEIEARLDAANAEVERLGTHLDAMAAERDEARAAHATEQAAHANTEAQRAAAVELAAERQATIEELQAEIEELMAQIEETPEPAPAPTEPPVANTDDVTVHRSYPEEEYTYGLGTTQRFHMFDQFDGGHGTRVLNSAIDVAVDFTINLMAEGRGNYSHVTIDGQEIYGNAADVVTASLMDDGGLSIYVTSATITDRFQEERLTYTARNAWRLHNGVPYMPESSVALQYAEDNNSLVAVSIENGAVNGNNNCDTDLVPGGVEEDEMVACGNLLHTAMVKGLTDNVIAIGAYKDGSFNAFISDTGVYAQHTIFFQSTDGSTSHATGIAGAMLAQIADKYGITDAVELKAKAFELAQIIDGKRVLLMSDIQGE